MKPKPDTFDDLTTLAAMGDGTLVSWLPAGVWSYANAAPDRSGTNLRLPIEYVSDARVQAAIKAGAWSVRAHGALGPMILAPADAPGTHSHPATAIGTGALKTETA